GIVKCLVVIIVFSFDEIEAVEDVDDCKYLVNDVRGEVDVFKIVPEPIEHYRQNKITHHRKADGEKHVSNICNKEDRKDTIKDERKFNTQTESIEVAQTNGYRITEEVDHQRFLIFPEIIQQQYHNTYH